MEALVEPMMFDVTDSRVLYTGLIVVLAGMRLVELAISRRNIAQLRARGAVEAGAGHYPWMVALHAAFLIACPLEVWLLDRPWLPALSAAMVALLIAAAALRYWVIATLGDRWSTRIVLVPGDPPVTAGPFRVLRHPNYLAVVVEFVALPLVHTAWLSAVIFSFANAMVLRRRVLVEEAALAQYTAYDSALGNRPRMIPGAR
jgi:methyltransferase